MDGSAKVKIRKCALWLVGAMIASRFYFVQELLAAFAFFAIGFTAAAFTVLAIYTLHKGWEMTVVRLLDNERVAEARLAIGWPGKTALKESEGIR